MSEELYKEEHELDYDALRARDAHAEAAEPETLATDEHSPQTTNEHG
jgi:hypothetical protein